jgi:hypothetical protein
MVRRGFDSNSSDVGVGNASNAGGNMDDVFVARLNPVWLTPEIHLATGPGVPLSPSWRARWEAPRSHARSPEQCDPRCELREWRDLSPIFSEETPAVE